MVTKLKSWDKGLKRWGIALLLILFMVAEMTVWIKVRPELVKEVNRNENYTKSSLFQMEFEKCIDKAIEVGLKGRGTSKWQEILNTKPNLIYYIYSGDTAYSNMNIYQTINDQVIEGKFSTISKPYYVKEFFARTGYRVYYEEGIYYKDYEKQDKNLKEKLEGGSIGVYIGVKPNLEPGDIFYDNSEKFIVAKERVLFFLELGIWSGFGLAGLLLLRILYKQIGNDNAVYKLEQVPMDLLVCFVEGVSLGVWQLMEYKMLGNVLGILIIASINLVLVISVIYQLKRKRMVQNTFICRQYLYWSQMKRLPFGILIGSGIYFVIYGLLLIACYSVTKEVNQGPVIIGFILWNIGGLIIVWRLGTSLQEVMKAASCISEGNIQYEIDLGKKGFILKTLGGKLNLMGIGLQKAVNNAIKSETMKTQLITNVSHDLKTPLTSVINYIGLLKKQEMPNETAQNYLEVLEDRSKRLKVLIEDLVEVSKVTTGNIQVELEKLDLIQFMDQAIGEYKDKLGQIPIEVKFKYTEEALWVMADGKHLWRIVENLFSNVVKYAMPGSRLYIELTREDEKVYFTIKNMTKESLEVLPEELLQRFVRGDQARSTEGSGLGLAIAKSLVEAQEGKLDIKIDGDLFKVKVELKGIAQKQL